MEKDFNKEIPTSDNAPGENAEEKELSILDEQLLLLAKQRSLQEEQAKLVEEKVKSAQVLASLKKSLFPNDPPDYETSPFLYAVSPKGSPIQESQNISEETIANSPDSTILTEESRQTNIVSAARINVLSKHTEGVSNTLQNLYEKVDSLKTLLVSHDETRASGAHTDFEIIDKNADSNVCYSGKGKSAVNPRYRYTKGSQKTSSSKKKAAKQTHKYKKKLETEVSLCPSLAKDTPAKRSEEATSISESNDSQESKIQVKKISPTMKRKGLDSIEKDHYRQHLDESCACSSGHSQISGNLVNDDEDLKTAKKMKLEGDKNVSLTDVIKTALCFNTNHETLDLKQFMTSEERDKFNLPSASGDTSNGEKSSLGNGSDVVAFSESEESSRTSVSSSGKEAAKKTHKNKKKTEIDVSSCSSLDKDNPSKPSEETSSTSESRYDSQESKIQVKKISPTMKRKGSDSTEKDHYREHLDESCASSSGLSQISGNLADDDEDLKTAKKDKLEGDKNVTLSDIIKTALCFNTNHESLDLQQFMTSEEREKWNLPSESGYTSNCEESSLENGSDVVSFSEREDSHLTSVSDMSTSEREESSLSSVSGMSPGERKESSLRRVSGMSPGERGEASLTSESENASSPCGNYFLQLILSEDKSPKAKDETTHDEASP